MMTKWWTAWLVLREVKSFNDKLEELITCLHFMIDTSRNSNYIL